MNMTIKSLVPALIALFGSQIQSQAEVTPVQIRLTANLGETFAYAVPAGKTLIMEQIIFNDAWKNSGEDMEINLRHEGISTAGTICCTTQRYTASINSLLRPIKLPAGKGIAVKNLSNSFYRVYIYGLLVDTNDLFASNFKEVKDVKVAGSGGNRTLDGSVQLKSPRPTRITFEQSDNLKDWAVASSYTSGSETGVPFSLAAPEGVNKSFVRATAKARPGKLLEPFPFILIPLPFPIEEG